jgi:hypothetical protein
MIVKWVESRIDEDAGMAGPQFHNFSRICCNFPWISDTRTKIQLDKQFLTGRQGCRTTVALDWDINGRPTWQKGVMNCQCPRNESEFLDKFFGTTCIVFEKSARSHCVDRHFTKQNFGVFVWSVSNIYLPFLSMAYFMPSRWKCISFLLSLEGKNFKNSCQWHSHFETSAMVGSQVPSITWVVSRKY